MSEALLREYRRIWQHKPALRAIYEDFYQRIAAQCQPGRSLEIGGGSGNLKQYRQDVISTDIVAASWLDAVADAQFLPFANKTFANIVAVDVLHHIQHPALFLDEAHRILEPRGRIILVEPGISPISRCFYHLFHPEPVRMEADPFCAGVRDPERDPFEANQAIPTLMFHRYRERFTSRFPNLKLAKVERFSFFAYPLSGGFRSWSLIPTGLITPLLRVEKRLGRFLGPLMSFRLFIVIENCCQI